MRVRAGTSGYSYKEWKGRFYPANLPASKMLPFYATRFSSVEINNTFYRPPTQSAWVGWREQVGDDFVFALKAPQQITHFLRLKGAVASLKAFLTQAQLLGDGLGPVLFQLPPNFKQDLPKLEAFLSHRPVSSRWTFEFRHPSWFASDTLAMLRAHDVALCLAEDEKLETPWEATASFGYLRLRKPKYTPAQLKRFAQRIRAEGWKEAFVFFKHEDEAKAPLFAARFEKSLPEGSRASKS